MLTQDGLFVSFPGEILFDLQVISTVRSYGELSHREGGYETGHVETCPIYQSSLSPPPIFGYRSWVLQELFTV